MWFDQQPHEIRCEWGIAGIRALAPDADVIIIVDVLSFSTCVDIAVAHGALVHPHAWKDESAAVVAREVGGVLAGSRSSTQLSLSPLSMRSAQAGQRIVLPSPNGAALSALTGSTPTLTGCLRNAATVAARACTFGGRIAVIPAGERWPDGTLRPALEDWLGAGAIIANLPGTLSPEARAARDMFASLKPDLANVIAGCASGRELIERGWECDVEIAVQLDASTTAPLLRDGAYCANE